MPERHARERRRRAASSPSSFHTGSAELLADPVVERHLDRGARRAVAAQRRRRRRASIASSANGSSPSGGAQVSSAASTSARRLAVVVRRRRLAQPLDPVVLDPHQRVRVARRGADARCGTRRWCSSVERLMRESHGVLLSAVAARRRMRVRRAARRRSAPDRWRAARWPRAAAAHAARAARVVEPQRVERHADHRAPGGTQAAACS